MQTLINTLSTFRPSQMIHQSEITGSFKLEKSDDLWAVSESVLVKWGLKAESHVPVPPTLLGFRECPCKMRIERTHHRDVQHRHRVVSESVLVKWGLKVMTSARYITLGIVSESVLVKWGLKVDIYPAVSWKCLCFRECPCKMRIESSRDQHHDDYWSAFQRVSL